MKKLSKTYRAVLWTLGVSLALTATIFACGWSEAGPSVRFGYSSLRDFSLLPPYPRHHPRNPDAEPDEASRQEWTEAEDARGKGDWATVRSKLREFLRRAVAERNEFWGNSPLPRRLPPNQLERNSAIDRLDALGALDRGSSDKAVAAYLDARAAYDEQVRRNSGLSVVADRNDTVRELIRAVPTDRNLVDNIAYLSAAVALAEGDFETAETGFHHLAVTYPNSEKREAALLMAALCKAKQTHWGEESQRTRDEIREGFQRTIREYPHGRFVGDARGWLGHLAARAGDYPTAAVEYYRMLTSDDEPTRQEGAFSLSLVRGKIDEAGMDSVERKLAAEPTTALAYAYHEIYNYAPSPNWQNWEATAEETRRLQSAGYARIAAFASRMMNRFPSRRIDGAFVLRAAMANFENGKDADASRLADQALRMGLQGIERARALWIRGIVEFRTGKLIAAKHTLQAIVTEKADTNLTEGARRFLAMTLERIGDRGAALDVYFALGYQRDIGYLVDVLMTPAELADFIQSHPNFKYSEELRYSLGIRYLRAGQWAAARAELDRVRTQYGKTWRSFTGFSWVVPMTPSKGGCPKYEDYADCDIPFDAGIRDAWIVQDIRTANTLERLEKAVATARGDEAKAEALYQFAGCQYQECLGFYNPWAWNRNRYSRIDQLLDADRFAVAGEDDVLFTYHQDHEGIARALRIYLDIADRFPNTRAARDALYTAAVCHERLSNFNPYWRMVYGSGRFAGSRLVTYDDVKRTYPDYQLPRGTFGWEPMTRTVNGKPGFAPKLPPFKPKTRLRKAAELAEKYLDRVFSVCSDAYRDFTFGLARANAKADEVRDRIRYAHLAGGVLTLVTIVWRACIFRRWYLIPHFKWSMRTGTFLEHTIRRRLGWVDTAGRIVTHVFFMFLLSILAVWFYGLLTC